MKTENWSIHAEFVIIFITLLGGFYMLDGKIDRQCQRTDKLYELYVEAREDSNKKWTESREDMNKKWTEAREDTNKKWAEAQNDIKKLYIDYYTNIQNKSK